MATIAFFESAGGWIALGVAAAAAAALLWKARSFGIAVLRALDSLQERVEDQRPQVEQRLEHIAGDIRAVGAAARADLGAATAGTRQDLRGLREALEELDRRLTGMAEAAAEQARQAQQAQQAARSAAEQTSRSLTSELRGVSQDMARAMETVSRKPVHEMFADPATADIRDEAQILSLAESIAVLRPLVPYPSWRTDIELFNPERLYQLRRWFWQYFRERKLAGAIHVPWYDGTRLRLFLGNDLSGQVYIGGCCEPNEFAFLDRILRPGMTFIDAGANDGLYTVFAARRVGPAGLVWAFEPSRRELQRLHYNLELNGLAARVFSFALAEREGEAELIVAGYEHEGHNTLGAFAYQGIEMEGKERVRLRCFDDVVAEDPPPRIDVLKLDVEGAELRLLLGAANAIAAYRPYLLFEVSEPSLRNQGTSRDELIAHVRAQSYAIYRFDPVTGVAAPAAPGQFSSNMIGVPEEKPLPDSARWPWPVPSSYK